MSGVRGDIPPRSDLVRDAAVIPEPELRIAEPPRLIPVKEAAARFGVSIGKFRELVRQGTAPQCIRLGDSTHRWHTDDISDALNKLAGRGTTNGHGYW